MPLLQTQAAPPSWTTHLVLGPMLRCHLRLLPSRKLAHIDHFGSMLRGAFGHALRQQACHCRYEPHDPNCPYARIFEPAKLLGAALAPEVGGGISPAFVITPPAASGTHGDGFAFSITLMGAARQYFRRVVEAWELAGQTGFGAGKVKSLICLDGIEQMPAKLRELRALELRFLSPLFLKKHGRACAVQAVTLETFLRALHHRLAITSKLYQVPALLPPLEHWLQASPHIRLENQLYPVHYQRYSNRQRQVIPMEGLLGSLHLSGQLPQSLLDALSLGEWLHIGGKTALGLGAYQVHTCPTKRIS